MSDNKGLRKLVIKSYANRDFTGEDPKRMFTTPINPESFSQTYKVNVDTQNGQGNDGSEARYKSTAPEELRLEFILDGTQTMEGYGGENSDYINMPVHEQLNGFKKCVYDMDGSIHRPRFLIVHWGSEIDFRCVLTNLDLSFSLFDPDGTPLRVKINANFLRHKSREEIQAESRKTSPDLTHYVKAKQSDRLDLMAYNIYNDSKYFLQVGSVNSIINLRHLKPGLKLLFPPFDKNEA